MTNNDILRRLRHALDLTDSDVVEAINKTGEEVTPTQIENWLKRTEDPGFIRLHDGMLCRFLDGVIILKRGMRDDGTIPETLPLISNNEILRKIRIALNLKDDDMNAIFAKAKFEVSKADLGSYFRKEGHRHYRPCPEQTLRKFIVGLGKKGKKPRATSG